MKSKKVFVTSRSFSANKFLRNKLLSIYPNTKFNDLGKKLNENELIDLASDAHKIIVALDKINLRILKKLPNLETISKYGVGLDNIKIKDIEKLNINFGWEPGQNSRAVSELVMGYMFFISRKLDFYQNNMKNLNNYQQLIVNEISKKNIGIIGMGSIGSDLLRLLTPLNCKIYYNDIRKVIMKNPLHIQCSLNYLLKKSDIISLHVPLTKKTKNLINYKNITLCKRDALIINCARGGIINENAIRHFLIKNQAASAAFDVFDVEPPKDNKLLELNNFFCSPHIGGSTEESIISMGLSAIRGLDHFTNLKKLYECGYE